MIEEAKAYPINEILDSIGCTRGRKSGDKVFYSSPFSSDSDPSLCVFLNNNTYHDFSNGYGGDAIDLVMKIEGCNFVEAVSKLSGDVSLDHIEDFIIGKSKEEDEEEINFSPSTYFTQDKYNIVKIREYANSRGIRHGYLPAVVSDFSTGERVYRLAMMFTHIKNGKPSGAKFRFIKPVGSRFTARGKLCAYILPNLIGGEDPVLYICESETSANSLWELMRRDKINGVVISMGGVGKQITIPNEYSHIKRRYLIIDYDGNEEKYEERVKFHGDVAEPIKLALPKGEDLNSLYVSGRIEEYKHLIF